MCCHCPLRLERRSYSTCVARGPRAQIEPCSSAPRTVQCSDPCRVRAGCRPPGLRPLWARPLHRNPCTSPLCRHADAVRRRKPEGDCRRPTPSESGHDEDLHESRFARIGSSGCSLAGRAVMTHAPTMVSLVEDYLAARRQMGFALGIAGEQLLAFGRFADQTGHCGPVTLVLAARWAQSSRRHTSLTWARRLEGLRPFAKYRSQFDAGTAILPTTFFGPAHRRLIPHIYTEQEIVALLKATDNLLPAGGLRPLTYRTLFGLLAAAGLRISEALHLKPQDVDL